MDIKSFIKNLREPKRPDVDIIGITKEAMNGDFTREQKDAIRSFPVNKMSIDEKILLTQSLSTFNTEFSVMENPSHVFSGKFRFDMLDKLFESEPSEVLLLTASKIESEYHSSMIPYLIGKYSKDTVLLNSVIVKSEISSPEMYRVGIAFNSDAPDEAFRYAYDYLKDIAPKISNVLVPLENVVGPVAGIAGNPSVPLDVLVDIVDDFGHLTGVHGGAHRVAQTSLDSRFKPKLMFTEDALSELSYLSYDVSKDGNDFIVTDRDLPREAPVHVKLVDDKVIGLDKLSVSAYQPMSAVVYNDYNDTLNKEIECIRERRNAVANVELSFDGLETQQSL